MTVDIVKVRENLKKRYAAKAERQALLWKKAVADFDTIINHLIKNYSLIRIYQWGSLLDKEMFREYSDIDIAIEGEIPAEKFFKMYAELQDLTDFPLDLVEIDRIDPFHADSIRRNGRLIYERPKHAE